MFEPHKNADAPDWQASVRILSLYLAVLLVLSAAAVFYVGWSSKAAQAQFMRAVAASSRASELLNQPSDAVPNATNKHRCDTAAR
jgi:hypothetical protein